LEQQGSNIVQGRADADALVYFDRALELNPGFAEAWSNKGILLRRIGQLTEAIQCQEKSLQIDPQNAKTWQAKGAA
jgi:tetratricopeptide (TPR) repeat protein